MVFSIILAGIQTAVSPHAVAVEAVDQAISQLKEVGAKGAGIKDAIAAADQLRSLPETEIPRLLEGMAEVNPVAENWFRGVIFDVVRRAGSPPLPMLEKFAMDRSNNATGRGVAMELIRKQAPRVAEELIAGCLQDPSLPLREMAVDQAMSRADSLADDDQEAAIQKYREALNAARHPRQVSRILEALEELDVEVTTAEAFAMIPDWTAVAPFDNRGGIGFDAIYPPEQQFTELGTLDLSGSYEGKQGSVAWKPIRSESDEGVVDLAAAYDKEKGAVCYLYTEFESSIEQPIDVRLASKNANKIWVNGVEVMANEVYHSGGGMIDQYVAPATLKKGTNKILLKLCQNEQTQSWAQDWDFQFRITDPKGKALRVAK